MDALVNVRGWVGSVVELRETAKGDVVKLRLATTSRFYRDGQWVDGGTVWFTVNAWRGLARNVAASVRKGDPIMVCGKLRSESWVSKSGDLHEDKVLEAVAIGHDLSKGRGQFMRVREDVASEGGASPAELASNGLGPDDTAEGEPLTDDESVLGEGAGADGRRTSRQPAGAV